MDDRIHEHARLLVDWSARVDAGDHVIVHVDEGCHELAVAVAAALGDRGATMATVYGSDEVERAYLRAHDGPFEPDPAPELALYEAADVVLSLRGGFNAAGLADVPGETTQAYARARRGIREARLATDWVVTNHPTHALAQQAGMAFGEYQDFLYGAVLRDWEALAEEMARMQAILDEGERVRIVAPGTDISMRIDGRVAVNSAASVAYDSHNLPSGEVFTAPHGTEGTVAFDVPFTYGGQTVRGAELTFEDGTVVDYDARENGNVLADILETDDGARRLGELGIGMNRGIDRFTDNVLFDEKMGDTIHLAVGRAYPANFPSEHAAVANESAVHVDMIRDVSTDARIAVDGEVIQRDGRFRWEDGFDG